MIIRPADVQDLEGIRAIHLDNWRTGHQGIMPDAFLGDPLEVEMAQRWASLPPAEDLLLVAQADDGLAGFGLVRCDHPKGPFLESLHVAACWRGRKIGERLLQVIVSELETRDMHSIWLTVLRDNDGARRFYARLNGQESPVFTDIVAGQAVSAINVSWSSLSLISDALKK